MKVKFVGGAGRITGSCHWLVHEKTGLQLLVDCGLIQGGLWTTENQPPFPFTPSRINALVLTHAHLDHCGRIPELFHKGFKGPIFCTRPTAELTQNGIVDVLSEDPKSSAQNKKFMRWLKDAFVCRDEHPNFRWAQPVPIDDDVSVGFLRSSHLLGAVGAVIAWADGVTSDGQKAWKSACFSGDIGTVLDSGADNDDINPHPLLKRTQVPHPGTDYIIMESTYGTECRDEKYSDFHARIDALRDIISRPNFSTVVFPTFSMGRTQDIYFDIMYLLTRVMPEVKCSIYMDSPMGLGATIAYTNALCQRGFGYRYRNDEVTRRFAMSKEEAAISRQRQKAEKAQDNPYHLKIDKDLQSLRDGAREAKAKTGNHGILMIKPAGDMACFNRIPKSPEDPENEEKQIIITSSGMFQGGPVIGHLGRLNKGTDAFVISGYQNTPLGKYLKQVACLGPVTGEAQNNALKIPGGFNLDPKTAKESGVRSFTTSEIRGRVFDLGGYYSGHADLRGLMRYLFESKEKLSSSPKSATVFLNHGTTERRHALRKFILDRTPEENDLRRVDRVEIPYMNSPFFDLDKGEWGEPEIWSPAKK